MVSQRVGPGASVNITYPGEMSLINWNKGNDWHFMDPTLIYTEEDIRLSGPETELDGGACLPKPSTTPKFTPSCLLTG